MYTLHKNQLTVDYEWLRQHSALGVLKGYIWWRVPLQRFVQPLCPFALFSWCVPDHEAKRRFSGAHLSSSARLHTTLIKLRKLRNTHGWKANIIFSLLSGHFELFNKRIRLTFWTILHFGVRSAICLPFTGSIEWEWLERNNQGQGRPRPCHVRREICKHYTNIFLNPRVILLMNYRQVNLLRWPYY